MDHSRNGSLEFYSTLNTNVDNLSRSNVSFQNVTKERHKMSDSNFSQDFAFLAAKHAALQQRKLRSKTFSVVDFAECTKPVFALLQPYLVGRVRGNFPSANWGFRNDDAF